jgi:tetratricopeptide (TPR) repeat protein
MTRRRIGLVLVVVVLLGGMGFGLENWWFRRELEEVRGEIARGRMAPALARLERLHRVPGAARSAEASFLLGMARWAAGQHDRALKAFARVPDGSEYDSQIAMFEAEAALRKGRLAEVEATLQRVLERTQQRYAPALEWMERAYRLQARFDDVRLILRARWKLTDKPVSLLKELWRLDRGTVPIESIREGLDETARRNQSVDDARVCLGRVRLALLAGRLDEARSWLESCLAAAKDPSKTPQGLSDAALWRAWLDWAAAAEKPMEVAVALDRLGPERLTRIEAWSWRAWLLRHRGDTEQEWQALQKLDALEPQQPRTLERLAALAVARGEASLALEFRARKASVDRALLAYDREIKAARDVSAGDASAASAFLGRARLAETAGRAFDAFAWASLATRLDPGREDAQALLTRLGQLASISSSPASGEDTASADWRSLAAELTSSPGADRAPLVREGSVQNLVFRDQASTSGLDFIFHNGATPLHQMPEPLSGGLGLLDYDGDGHLDVYVVQGGPFPPGPAARGDRLFRNRGDGTFEDATTRAGVDRLPQGYGHGVAVGDYDNDGDPDLFVTRWRSYALYRNVGGRFEDATGGAGLSGDRDWPTSSAFGDMDGDGDLDLYVCHYLAWDTVNPKPCRNARTGAYVSCSPLQLPSLPDHLFRNDGGRFVDVTESAGISDHDGRGLGVVLVDVDGDGRLDIYVANDMSANFLYHNMGGLRFEEIGQASGVAGTAEGGYQAGMGVACGDLDGDGRPDLAVTNFYGEGTSLYQNQGGGFFIDRSREAGLATASRYRLGFGIAFLDVDNDGRLDLMTANGHLDDLGDVPYRMPLQLFRGDGRTLRDVSTNAGPSVAQPRLGRGLAVGDMDNDGRLDALVVDHNAPLADLRNQTERVGHWLVLQLEGVRSNRDGVGAVVTIRAGGRVQVLQRFGGGSYQSASDPRLHAGLGAAARVEEVEVRWPSGQVDRWKDLPADRGYRLREGDATPTRLKGFER